LNAIYHPILLYDDDCGVCGRTVQFILRHDRRGEFRFAPLDSSIGRQLLSEHGVEASVDSVVVIDERGAAIRSGAVLAVLRRLGGGWHLLRGFGVIPRPIRDWLYDALARRRHLLSRHLKLTCYVPTPRERARFLG
jgi:predicted DCC family thiol-disulfide oxidoreductase YuxK